MDDGLGHAQPAQPANAGTAKRSPDVHWPARFAPDDADLFSHNEILIAARASQLWRHLLEAPKWPLWYPDVQAVRIVRGGSNLLRKGSRFEFNILGQHIDAKVGEFAPFNRIGWFGKGDRFEVYHTWLLVDVAGGCHVVTEVVAKGPGTVAIRKPDPDVMHKRYDLWLNKLKRIAEMQPAEAWERRS